MEYVIIQKFITKNRSGKLLTPTGIVVHDTATPGATALNEYNYFNSAYRGASAHAFVDWTQIIQTIPWTERAWHAGPTANSRFIGIELCVPKIKNEQQFSEVWNRAVWLFAYLFINVVKQTKITKDNLMSHAEVSAKWKETDHTDPVAYFKQYNKTVNDFRNAVQQKINEMLKNNKIVASNNIIVPKQGIVIAKPYLNIRKEPSVQSMVIGRYMTNAKINIIGKKNGWYQTADGWVSAQYVKLI